MAFLMQRKMVDEMISIAESVLDSDAPFAVRTEVTISGLTDAAVTAIAKHVVRLEYDVDSIATRGQVGHESNASITIVTMEVL